jgi:hypothetical protein
MPGACDQKEADEMRMRKPNTRNKWIQCPEGLTQASEPPNLLRLLNNKGATPINIQHTAQSTLKVVSQNLDQRMPRNGINGKRIVSEVSGHSMAISIVFISI